MTTYQVQAGDTLGKIAAAHNTSAEKLAKLNHISNPDKILVGQTLIFEAEVPNQPIQKEEVTTGFDTFQRTEQFQQSAMSPCAPLAYGLGGAALYQTGKWAMPKIQSGMENMQLRGMYAQDAIRNRANGIAKKNKQTATAVRNFVAQKAKHAAKSAELHYAFGKDAVKQGAKKAVKKGKTVARYTRFVGNTKIAPKLIKGASRYAAPAAALYGIYEVKQAYDKGGEKAAVKQAVKTGGGLAGGWAGAKVGAAVGSFAGPIGTVVGGVIGGVAGYFLGEKLCS